MLESPEISKQLRSCSQEGALSCQELPLGTGQCGERLWSPEEQPSQAALVGGMQTDLIDNSFVVAHFLCLAFVLSRSGSALARLFGDGRCSAPGGRRSEDESGP